jgi:hypothetical protein
VDTLVECRKALRERARRVVLVPVECLGEGEALRRLQAERVDVGQEDQQAGKLLSALDDAEFGRLLDRIGRVAAGVGQADDLGLRRLRLQQERREVLVVDRRLDATDYLAAILQDGCGGVALSAWPNA